MLHEEYQTPGRLKQTGAHDNTTRADKTTASSADLPGGETQKAGDPGLSLNYDWVRQRAGVKRTGDSDLFHIDCLRSLLALFDLERDFLPFAQRFETLAFDCTEVDKNIRTAVYFYKPITLLLIEPLHSTFRHYKFPFTKNGFSLAGTLFERLSGSVLQRRKTDS